MAERLRSTGRKSNVPPAAGAAWRTAETASITTIQASAALAAAAKNAPRQPAPVARMSAQRNDSAPEMPMLAACPAVARDSSLASTRSASSFSPVM
jgi:hypothetical protein